MAISEAVCRAVNQCARQQYEHLIGRFPTASIGSIRTLGELSNRVLELTPEGADQYGG
jgi:hypothetical protein